MTAGSPVGPALPKGRFRKWKFPSKPTAPKPSGCEIDSKIETVRRSPAEQSLSTLRADLARNTKRSCFIMG